VSVTYPAGFVAAGVTAGLKPSGRPDLGLLVGDRGTTVAGVFTTNLAAAAPVRLSRRRLAEGAPRMVLVNSGQANAATGERGDEDARAATAATALALGTAPEEVLQCSTGVIGEPVHMLQLLDGMPTLVAALGPAGGGDFALSIMTTDTVDKQVTTEVDGARIGGCAKGVGMIAPDLATMLAFITTDAAVAAEDLRRIALAVVAPRFNAITVDGCTSTNDTVLLFASGAAGRQRVEPGSRRWVALADGIEEAAEMLAQALIADAEGGTHALLIDVEGAASEADARVLAKAVAGSALVKTAAFGGDLNPGRIIQAIGSSGVIVDPGRVDIAIGDVPVVIGGVIPPTYFEGPELADAAKARMRQPQIEILVRVGEGPGRSRSLGCDLSYDYVRINGEYTT
jgi:glutamate N-acetyltransferase/amino-acid N-acetyltransferase